MLLSLPLGVGSDAVVKIYDQRANEAKQTLYTHRETSKSRTFMQWNIRRRRCHTVALLAPATSCTTPAGMIFALQHRYMRPTHSPTLKTRSQLQYSTPVTVLNLPSLFFLIFVNINSSLSSSSSSPINSPFV